MSGLMDGMRVNCARNSRLGSASPPVMEPECLKEISMARNDSNRAIRHLVESLFRHKTLSFLVAVGICALGVGTLVFMPRTYRSESKLFLRVGRETVGMDETAKTGGETIAFTQSSRDNEVTSAIEVARSREVTSKVVGRLGAGVILGQDETATGAAGLVGRVMKPIGWVLNKVTSLDPLPIEEQAIIEVEENLSVDAELESTVMVFSYQAKTPELARKVLDELINVYNNEHMRIHRSDRSTDFFLKQQEGLQTQLDTARDKLRDAKNQSGVVSIVGRRDALTREQSETELELSRTELNLATAQSEITRLETQMTSVPERIETEVKTVADLGTDALREQLYILVAGLQELESRLTPQHPKVVARKKQVEMIELRIAEEGKSREESILDVNPVFRELKIQREQAEARLAGLTGRMEALSRQRDRLLAAVNELNESESLIDRLTQDVELASAKVSQYAESYERARIDKQMENEQISNISVLQTPTLQRKPVSPSKLAVILATLAMALGAPIALALGLDQFDTRIRRTDELEDVLGLPVLATIPEGSEYSRPLTSRTAL